MQRVRRIRLPSGVRAWVVSDAQLARTVLTDSRFTKRRAVEDDATHYLYRHMLTLDAPQHTRLRALVAGHFLPGRIASLRARIGRDCDELLFALPACVDLVAAFARPLALRTICALTGIPIEDAPRIDDWAQRLVRADFEDSGQFPVIAEEMCAYLSALLDRTPPDASGPVFAHLADAVGRGLMDTREMFSMTFLLLNAGFETSANLIAGGIFSLLSNAPAWGSVCSDPEIAARAVEELLRYESPLRMSTPRFAAERVELDGNTIGAGEMIFAGLAEANRNAAQFPEPDRLDVCRENAIQHMAFGHGAHFCIGAPLARMEAEIAIASFARRFPGARCDGAPVWDAGFVMRNILALPLILDSEP